MARMIPSPLRPGVTSPAERKLYAGFASQLPDDFTVFHQVAWQVRDARRGAQDGEADFVVAHPQAGVLIIEVKGGAIRYDGAAAQWYSHDHPIKDPFEQARQSKYSLLEKLRELPYWQDRWLALGHAVAFPDVVVDQSALRPDAPRDIVLDARDMGRLAQRVQELLDYWRGQDTRAGAPGTRGVEALVRLLSPSWELQPLLGVQITEEAEELVRLTEEQFWVLDFLGRHRRAAICGCAGSGKTLLAAEKARRLIRQGFHVLLTCFNRYLAEFLKASLVPNDGLHVAHFHGLCTEWARRAGILVGSPSEQDRQRFFDEILPEQLLDAVDCLGPQYDAIVVDEGQDFRENWWVPLQCLLHDPDAGILYVFFDDNQNLYQAEPSILLPIAPYPLTHNCRNTRRIHGTVSRFYRADHPTVARGPEGRPVDVRIYTDVAGLKRHLRKVLHQLVMEDGVPASDIIVLTPRKRERSALWQFGLLGNFRLTDQPTGGHGDVFCTTVHAFKGLESPVVVLAEVEPEASKDLETVLYVGCSRARHHLIILASADLPGETRERLG